MQFHYVVTYDMVTQKWGVEFDTNAYFSDGNVLDNSTADLTWSEWFDPNTGDTPNLAVLDQTLFNTLYSLVDIIPIPKEHENA